MAASLLGAAGFALTLVVEPASAAELPLMMGSSSLPLYEPPNALSLPTWAIHGYGNDRPKLAMYKNRLQEYTKKSSIPLPVYETINKGGVPHEPRFRSTVRVDGASYTSHDVFSQRKAAEQDVARMALDGITQKILIREETVFCKSILHEFPVFCKSILSEYAVKMHLEKPTYNTTWSVGLLPLRVSALVFNSVTYTGEAGKNKEAEQLAARKVILSILDTSDLRTVITEIIKSKVKVNEGDSTQSGINPVAKSTAGTIVFVPPAQALEQPLDIGSSSTKKRRKKAKKKSRDDAQLPVAVVA
ncbi:double-stranded RNA-binding protein 4-like [Camellia sinensis]|uniref:double-stranded RNA-binding protein 4-like n=1 Tax=Camellia sinensis TaxID=4442 RepID=UPI0010360666|nr:double-stranded RNA-binding protein 4-like [Camellia sinensis]